MALSTYAQLKTSLATLLNRVDLTDSIPDFIALMEADFDADERTAKHRRRICRSTAVISNEYETLAPNFLAAQSVALEGEPIRQLQYVDPDTMVRYKQDADAWRSIAAYWSASSPGAPLFYSIVGTEIRFFPVPETTYTCDLTVYERVTQLASAADTNWLLTYFPNIYLYGSAIHSAPFLGADERIATWMGLYDQAVEKLMKSDPVPTSKATLRTELYVANRYGGVC